MRLWNVPPAIMCRKHLLGEHVEIHMFVGAIRKGISMAGFLKAGVLQYDLLKPRHEAIVDEMASRGYNHNTPWVEIELPNVPDTIQSEEDSLKELLRRCPECRARYLNHLRHL